MRIALMVSDVAIPLAFPSYQVLVDNDSDTRLPLGHAGVLCIDGKHGITQYFEYGRYDREKKGIARKIPNIPNVKIFNGKVTRSSLAKTFHIISKEAGHGGYTTAAYIKIND